MKKYKGDGMFGSCLSTALSNVIGDGGDYYFGATRGQMEVC